MPDSTSFCRATGGYCQRSDLLLGLPGLRVTGVSRDDAGLRVEVNPTCLIPEIARLGRTLNQWRDPFLGYFTTGGANNGGAEAINGLIELARRVASGFRNPDDYRLRMLLIGDGLRI